MKWQKSFFLMLSNGNQDHVYNKNILYYIELYLHFLFLLRVLVLFELEIGSISLEEGL